LAVWTKFDTVRSAPRLIPIMTIFVGFFAMAAACGLRRIVLTIISGGTVAGILVRAVIDLFMMHLHRDRWRLCYTASSSMPNETCKICANLCEGMPVAHSNDCFWDQSSVLAEFASINFLIGLLCAIA
jgi:hypothetical protein